MIKRVLSTKFLIYWIASVLPAVTLFFFLSNIGIFDPRNWPIDLKRPIDENLDFDRFLCDLGRGHSDGGAGVRLVALILIFLTTLLISFVFIKIGKPKMFVILLILSLLALPLVLRQAFAICLQGVFL